MYSEVLNKLEKDLIAKPCPEDLYVNLELCSEDRFCLLIKYPGKDKNYEKKVIGILNDFSPNCAGFIHPSFSGENERGLLISAFLSNYAPGEDPFDSDDSL